MQHLCYGANVTSCCFTSSLGRSVVYHQQGLSSWLPTISRRRPAQSSGPVRIQCAATGAAPAVETKVRPAAKSGTGASQKLVNAGLVNASGVADMTLGAETQALVDRTKGMLGVVESYLQPDGGPPRWFAPVDAKPPTDQVPLMLFIPGIDGTGLGASLQEVRLAKLFELRCLHIPAADRTHFLGLVELVESALLEEQKQNPDRPLYLLGESFGGLVALAVAQRNPQLYLHLVLVNPATAFSRSELQPLLPLLRALPDELYQLVPYALSATMGDPLRMAAALVDPLLPLPERLQAIADRLFKMLPSLSMMTKMLPRETLNWKLDLLKEGGDCLEGKLEDVKAPVLLLSSGKDRMLPSEDESKRLAKLLPRCVVQRFKDNGHTLLLEGGVDIAKEIKRARLYRRTKADEDTVRNFMPPSPDDLKEARGGLTGTLRRLTSPVYFSTLENGKVVRRLEGVPTEGPLLFVAYHQLYGLDLGLLVDEVLQEKNLLIRGLAHPIIMNGMPGSNDGEGAGDLRRLFQTFGAVEVNGANLFKLLETEQAALLFPGGVAEAYHSRNERYKCLWPEKPEFVRTAVRHGATIVPVSAIGADESFNVLADPQELLRLPIIGDRLRQDAQKAPSARETKEDLFVAPFSVPSLPSRFYFLFGKPIPTAGLSDSGFLKDKERAMELYLHVKEEVQKGMDYLIRKREDDPYRDFLPRSVYEATWGGRQAPTFRS